MIEPTLRGIVQALTTVIDKQIALEGRFDVLEIKVDALATRIDDETDLVTT